MLTAKDYRQRAWNALNGNWGTVAITYLLVMVVSSFCGGLSAIGIGAILLFVLEGPIQYGFSFQSLNVVRHKSVDVKDILAAQNRFADSVIAFFINTVYTFLWTLLFIIPGIIAAYSYSLTYYIMIDNPKLTPDQARRESVRLMQGHKWELFCLQLSFFGWILLCALTFGILAFWVMPYMQAATAEFYDCLIPTRPTVEQVKPAAPDPFESEYVEVKENKTGSVKQDEPFYVFEEERPKQDDNNEPFDTVSDKWE